MTSIANPLIGKNEINIVASKKVIENPIIEIKSEVL